jgi:hypothetical protein
MRVGECGLAADYIHPVAQKLIGDDGAFTRYDFVYAGEQLRNCRPVRCSNATIRTVRGSREVQHRLTESFTWYRAGGDARSANRVSSLDEGNALAQLRRLNSAALARRSAADADEIVVEGVCHR